VADRIAVLHLGRMVAEGPVGEFDRQSTVEYMTTGKGGRSNTPVTAANGEAG
jgi:ABC-type sugar transport system ATPase subunit